MYVCFEVLIGIVTLSRAKYEKVIDDILIK